MEKIHSLKTIVINLKPGVDGCSTFLQELVEYEAMIAPHLLQEEVECLPLCRAYFTPEEIGAKVQEMLAHGPKVELGSFIHASKFCRTAFRDVCGTVTCSQSRRFYACCLP